MISARLDVPKRAIEALIESGRLSEAESRDPRLVERELALVIADFTSRWINK